MSCKDEVVKCLKQCSVKGVPRLFKVQSVHLRGLWAVAILLFLGTGFYQSYELIAEYLSYPKLTIVKETEFSAGDDYVFPTIQICNVNQLGLLQRCTSERDPQVLRPAGGEFYDMPRMYRGGRRPFEADER